MDAAANVGGHRDLVHGFRAHPSLNDHFVLHFASLVSEITLAVYSPSLLKCEQKTHKVFTILLSAGTELKSIRASLALKFHYFQYDGDWIGKVASAVGV